MKPIRKSEGGSGGKKGHSNMTHWDRTRQVKDFAKKVRRNNDKLSIKEQNER